MKVSVSILVFWLCSFNASTRILAETQQGECTVDAETGECKAPPTLPTADDDDDDYELPPDEFPECVQWAKDGECTVNSNFMQSKCIKSCSLYRQRDFSSHQRGPYRAFLHSETCQLYMAESSIPNSGLGMYTAVPIKQNRMIFHPDIVVNYFDFQFHNNIAKDHFQNVKYDPEIEKLVEGKKDKDTSCRKWAVEGECDANPKYMLNSCSRSCVLVEAGVLKEVDEKFWVPDDYYWDAGNTESDYEADVVSALVPGLGALANSHTGLVNAHMQRGRVDATSFHRSKDPGTGAFSNFHNLGYMAKENIPAGMELFVEYGDEWFSGREWKFGPIPLSWHFEETDRIVNEFWSHADEVSVDGFAEDLFQTTKTLITDVKLSMAMPDSLQNAEKARHNGTAILSVPNAIQSQEWLEENGICLDNIVSIQSAVAQAGRGAAATRNLKKGEIIAPLPVIHMDRRRLRMFVHDEDSDDPPVEKAEQLIVNYSYGHKDSSLLLFPYSPVVNFINTNLDKSRVNARVRWSTSRYHAKDWEDLTTDEVLDKKRTGLMLEIVATRDIEQGEEVFIDYGEDWDEAWNDFLKSWKPVEDDYLPLHMLNSRDNVLTKLEQVKHPLPSNAMTICFIHTITEMPGGGTAHYSDHASGLDAFRHTQECEIERRYEEIDEKTGKLTTLYEVKVKIGTKENRNSNSAKATITGVPRKAIEYVNTPYSSDQHLPHLFRHPIHIPDEIFPQKWRDLADESINDGQEFVHDTVEAAWDHEQGAFEECQFWLAESSIPNSGVGLYSGVNLRPGNFSLKEIIIPIHDREQNTKLRCDLSPLTCKQNYKWLIEDYEWGDSLGWAKHEAKETFFANPGFGSIPNHHVGMSSACPQIALKSNGALHRSRDAASGSISPYDSLSFEITRHLEAGQEIFINYGEGYFEDKLQYANMTKRYEFLRANNIATKFLRQMEIMQITSQEEIQEEWIFERKEFIFSPKLLDLLPIDSRELKRFVSLGSVLYNSPTSLRSIDWLQKNGRCLDNIKVDKSTIRGAGRGAFATRYMKKGEVLITSPVLQHKRDAMGLFQKVKIPSGYATKQISKQLILNYMIGHKNSSLLLFPIAPSVNAINHGKGQDVNAIVRWSSFRHHKSEWLDKSVEDILSMEQSGLFVDYIATRDIQPGDEIFIQYGFDFENAWQRHVSSYKPSPESTTYHSAFELTSKDGYIRTMSEEPYSDNVEVRCTVPQKNWYLNAERTTFQSREALVWEKNEPDMHILGFDMAEPCQILERHYDSDREYFLYTVEVTQSPYGSFVMTQVQYVYLVDKKYTIDVFLPNAFRHEIHVHDLFPEHWLDLK